MDHISELTQQAAQAAREVLATADQYGLTVGTAESCTGGMVAAALTEVPGSSARVLGSIVSYALTVKRSVLGVSPEVLDDPSLGAVSDVCAHQMAQGARRVLGCDVAVSITGIAGPTGAEPGKPLGTVWFGVAGPNGARERLCHFDGTRREVRLAATLEALNFIREALVENAS